MDFDLDEERVINRLLETMRGDLEAFMFIPRGYNNARILNEVRRRFIELALKESKREY